jgi:uncharacterized membrane protein
MKLKRIVAILASVSLIVTGLLAASFVTRPSIAHADVNNFTITSFAAQETLSRNNPHGELLINEDIKVHFTDNNHGLLRAIPESYKSNSLNIHNISVSSSSGAPSSYTTYKSNGNLVLKIGEPTRTVTGDQDYLISYTLDNVISFYKDHDELYWDINGDQWAQPANYVGVYLTVPKDLAPSQSPVCYAGSSNSASQNCVISNTASNVVSASTTNPLLPYQTLTIVDGFKTGYFTPVPWYQSQLATNIIKAALLPLVVLIVCIVLWRARGKDPKGRGTIIPEYGPPEGLTPIQVGTIVDFKVDNRDITATIIDLAIRKYLTVIETTKDHKILKDTTSYSLKLMNADFSTLNKYEVELITALFPGGSVGQVVEMADKKNQLYTTAQLLRKSVEQDLTDAGYFRSNPLSSGSSLTLVSVVLLIIIFAGGSQLGLAFAAGAVIAAIIAGITSRFMASRTAKGVAANEDSLGLKLYLETAEADRLKMLQGPNAAYAANAGEPVRTVDLFEKLLPYAMVLGVEKEWAKQFEGIYTQPPSWYSGNFNTFSAFYLASSLSSGMQSVVDTAFTAPSSSGSSGFGGGGFSGGGGGGGGGGGW